MLNVFRIKFLLVLFGVSCLNVICINYDKCYFSYFNIVRILKSFCFNVNVVLLLSLFSFIILFFIFNHFFLLGPRPKSSPIWPFSHAGPSLQQSQGLRGPDSCGPAQQPSLFLFFLAPTPRAEWLLHKAHLLAFLLYGSSPFIHNLAPTSYNPLVHHLTSCTLPTCMTDQPRMSPHLCLAEPCRFPKATHHIRAWMECQMSKGKWDQWETIVVAYVQHLGIQRLLWVSMYS